MSKKLFFLCFFISSFPFINFAQLISHQLLESNTISEVELAASQFGVPAALVSIDFAVDVYKIIYETPDAQGNMTQASGAFCVPKDNQCALPMASYQHGTTAEKTGVPSYFSEEINVGIVFGGTGYYVALPDYLGLGDSPGLHPYVHAATEASATIDMLRACRMVIDLEGFSVNDQLFLFGYSQGGHATAAAQKAIEDNFSDEFQITASNPMSGPYDISGEQSAVITSGLPYPTPSYLPYVLLAYQSVYGNLFDTPSDILVAPYDETIPPLFDGTYSTGYINNQMPNIPNEALVPEQLDDFINNPDNPLRAALEDNDLYDWAPQAPTRLTYCEGDDQVGFMNSIVAYDHFVANGAPDVELLELGANLDHGACAGPAFLSGKFFFDSYKEEGLSIQTTTVDPINGMDGAIDIVVNNGFGTITYEWDNGANTASLDNLSEGWYQLTVSDEKGCSTNLTVQLGMPSTISSIGKQSLEIFPNPATTYAEILFPQSGQNYKLRLINSVGMVVFENQLKSGNSYLLSTKEFVKGIYIVELISNERYIGKLQIN